jgi:hypothetical protein
MGLVSVASADSALPFPRSLSPSAHLGSWPGPVSHIIAHTSRQVHPRISVDGALVLSHLRPVLEDASMRH